jgi:restriction endonuclease S subunit
MSWPLARLSAVASINPRRPPIERDDDVLTSFVPMDAVDDITGEIVRLETLPYRKLKKGYTHFQEGDVIFAKITPCMQNGKHAVVRRLIDDFGFGSTEFHVIRPSEHVLSEWIHFFLRRRATLNAAAKTFTGTVGQQRVPPSFLEDLELPLPTLKEQRLIATRLKAQLAEVDTARKASLERWGEVKSLKSKALEAAFDNLDDWQPIGSVAELQSGYAFKSEAFKPGGVRLLRNANILPGKVYWDDTVYISEEDAQRFEAYRLVPSDVLISLDRPVISSGIKVARVSDADLPALLLQRVGRFVLDPSRLDADYLFAFLQTDRFIAEISGHEQSLGVPHISPGQVEAIEIPLPDLAIQRQLARQLTQITEAWSTAVAALQRQLYELDILPQRLLAHAFEN